MHPGLDDDLLFKFKGPAKYKEIKEIVERMYHCQLSVMSDQMRIQFLRNIVNTLQNIPIETLDDFIKSLTLACQIHLLHDVSPIVIENNKALSIILDRNLDDLIDDPIKIHLVSESLYGLVENDLNLIYIVGNISFYNNFSYFVSLSLVWAALHRVADIEIKMFRLYEFKELSKIIKKFPTDIVKDQTKFYRILSLISLLQNIYILRDHSAHTYGKYSDCFQFEKSDVESILIDWLNNVRLVWESISKVFKPQAQIEDLDDKSKLTNDKSIEITELLIVDIIGLFESNDYNKCCI